MRTRAALLLERLRSPEGQKLVRYSLASVVAVVVSLLCLVLFNGVLGLRAWLASTLATAIATVPSYELNRKWAWGKTGPSHVWKEVVPFWVLAFVGWGLSTGAVHLTEDAAMAHHVGHLERTALVATVYVAAFGVLWVCKFVIFNRLLFVSRDAPAGATR